MTNFQKDVSLKDYSNFKIGGKAKYFCNVESVAELEEALKEWKEFSKDFPSEQKKIYVLGEGTNVLFADKGFNGLVIRNSINFIHKEGSVVEAGAGTPFSKVLDFCIENSLSGLEWAGGLPGTVGGAVRGNAGAYNGETKDYIFKVESMDLYTLEKKERTKEQCKFGYRQSIFKKGDAEHEVITSIEFKLNSGDREQIKSKIQGKIDARKLRHPLEYPNIGSIFQNVPVGKFSSKVMEELNQYVKNDPFPVIPTAKLNFLAGLKGKRVGDAQLSEKHTNFIINLGHAKASDVRELIEIVKSQVKKKYGVDLEPEVMFVD